MGLHSSTHFPRIPHTLKKGCRSHGVPERMPDLTVSQKRMPGRYICQFYQPRSRGPFWKGPGGYTPNHSPTSQLNSQPSSPLSSQLSSVAKVDCATLAPDLALAKASSCVGQHRSTRALRDRYVPEKTPQILAMTMIGVQALIVFEVIKMTHR